VTPYDVDAGNRIRERLQPDEDWADTETCANRLCVDKGTLTGFYEIEGATRALRRISRSIHGNGGCGVGFLYRRTDIDRLRHIMGACGVGARTAVRILIALKRGDLT